MFDEYDVCNFENVSTETTYRLEEKMSQKKIPIIFWSRLFSQVRCENKSGDYSNDSFANAVVFGHNVEIRFQPINSTRFARFGYIPLYPSS